MYCLLSKARELTETSRKLCGSRFNEQKKASHTLFRVMGLGLKKDALGDDGRGEKH